MLFRSWDIPKSAPVGTSSIGTPWSWLEGIPEEEESSVKDSVTSGIPLRPRIPGAEASGSGELLIPLSKAYAHGGEDTVIKTKNGPCGQQNRRKRGVVYGSHGIIRMAVERLLGPC